MDGGTDRLIDPCSSHLFITFMIQCWDTRRVRFPVMTVLRKCLVILEICCESHKKNSILTPFSPLYFEENGKSLENDDGDSDGVELQKAKRCRIVVLPQ